MITYFKFKDMIDIAYHSNNDCLYLSLSDNYLQNNSPFKNSNDYPIDSGKNLPVLEYTKRTTDNKKDLENNIVSIILKLHPNDIFGYNSGCYVEYFISKFNKKTDINVYDWDSYLRVFKKQPLLKFTKLIIVIVSSVHALIISKMSTMLFHFYILCVKILTLLHWKMQGLSLLI